MFNRLRRYRIDSPGRFDFIRTVNVGIHRISLKSCLNDGNYLLFKIWFAFQSDRLCLFFWLEWLQIAFISMPFQSKLVFITDTSKIHDLGLKQLNPCFFLIQ